MIIRDYQDVCCLLEPSSLRRYVVCFTLHYNTPKVMIVAYPTHSQVVPSEDLWRERCRYICLHRPVSDLPI